MEDIAPKTDDQRAPKPHVLLIDAPDAGALRAQAARMADRLAEHPEDLTLVCSSSAQPKQVEATGDSSKPPLHLKPPLDSQGTPGFTRAASDRVPFHVLRPNPGEVQAPGAADLGHAHKVYASLYTSVSLGSLAACIPACCTGISCCLLHASSPDQLRYVSG